MTTKNLAILAAVAAAVGAAAYFTGGPKNRAPSLSGKKIVADFDLADVASVEIGDKVKLDCGEAGWEIASMQGYPADRERLVRSLSELKELKVGQTARGRELGRRTDVVVKDSSGKVLASVTLGDRHEKWGHGRYAEFEGQTVLVADTLDAFGDDPKRWCSTKIIDSPYVSFKDLADPSLDEEALGFATGVVKTVTIEGDTNRVATVGNVVPGGTDRYLRLDGTKWTFIVTKYAAESLLPKPEEKEPEATPEPEAVPKPAAESEPAPKAAE